MKNVKQVTKKVMVTEYCQCSAYITELELHTVTTPWHGIFLEQLIVIYLVKKFPTFLK